MKLPDGLGSRRLGGIIVFACALLATAAIVACGTTDVQRPVGPSPTERMLGRVMRSSRWPANGRIVHLKDHQPVTVKGGHFTFDGVPSSYDVWVGLAGESPITAYRGLTRRDPLLQHAPAYMTALDEPARRASISGIVRGDFPFPIEKGYLLYFFFLSKETTSAWPMDDHSPVAGPRFGRASVMWNGAENVAGLLVAIGYRRMAKHLEAVALATAPLQLADKVETTAELTLEPVAMGHIAGEIKVPHTQRWSGALSYRLNGDRVGMSCVFQSGPYDCQVPDLTALGGTYCLELSGERGSVVQHCGGKIGMTDFSVEVQAPPELRLLDQSATSAAKIQLTWTGDEQAVYLVNISPRIGPDIEWFELNLYTSGTRLDWKDLDSYGISTPAGPNRKYQISVSRMLPYRTVDEIASSAGPLSPTVEYQRLSSEPLEIELKE